MDFENTRISKQQTHRITLEIDVIGNEEDFEKCEKLSQAFSAFITQWWWLADSRFQFVCSTRVKTLTINATKKGYTTSKVTNNFSIFYKR